MRLIRVFPRETTATPRDDLVFLGPPDLFTEPADEVHISMAFTADKLIAERLAYDWQGYAPKVLIGGPGTGQRSEEFVAGKYLRHGCTITSRGCPCTCWFCDVPWRENVKPKDPPRELPIVDGWNVMDDNLLACSRPHVEAVFKMLQRVCDKEKTRAKFTGGLWAKGLQDYQVGLLADLHPKPACFFAYDPGDHFDTLRSAAERMLAAGFTTASHRLQVYVLIGYPNDTFTKATERLQSMKDLGFTPFAMLWQPTKPVQEKWLPSNDWLDFRRTWIRPAIIHAA